jgi:hypothetical protein
VFKFGTSKPKTLHWKELDRIVTGLGAVYIGNGKGDHRKYHRVAGNKTYIIVFSEFKACGQDIINSVIRMSGVSAKQFWNVYHGAKFITGEEASVKVTK